MTEYNNSEYETESEFSISDYSENELRSYGHPYSQDGEEESDKFVHIPISRRRLRKAYNNYIGYRFDKATPDDLLEASILAGHKPEVDELYEREFEQLGYSNQYELLSHDDWAARWEPDNYESRDEDNTYLSSGKQFDPELDMKWILANKNAQNIEMNVTAVLASSKKEFEKAKVEMLRHTLLSTSNQRQSRRYRNNDPESILYSDGTPQWRDRSEPYNPLKFGEDFEDENVMRAYAADSRRRTNEALDLVREARTTVRGSSTYVAPLRDDEAITAEKMCEPATVKTFGNPAVAYLNLKAPAALAARGSSFFACGTWSPFEGGGGPSLMNLNISRVPAGTGSPRTGNLNTPQHSHAAKTRRTGPSPGKT